MANFIKKCAHQKPLPAPEVNSKKMNPIKNTKPLLGLEPKLVFLGVAFGMLPPISTKI